MTLGATVEIKNLFLTPTISIDKSEVKRGETIAISGQSVPNADITVTLPSGLK